MAKSDQEQEDEVLRRMLNTPPTPHKEQKKGDRPKPAPSKSQE